VDEDFSSEAVCSSVEVSFCLAVYRVKTAATGGVLVRHKVSCVGSLTHLPFPSIGSEVSCSHYCSGFCCSCSHLRQAGAAPPVTVTAAAAFILVVHALAAGD
jgi:hypothetical protein